MWKFQKIVWWAALVWSLMFGWNSMAQTANTRDVNTTNTEILQKNSSEQLLDVFNVNPENLDREKINNMDIADVPIDVLRYWMLRKLNEIRKANGVKPLKYDEKLASVAQNFANDDRDFEWWNNSNPHRDSKWLNCYNRLKNAWLIWNYIQTHVENGLIKWRWENLWSISWHTINTIFEDWMNSKWHKENILAKDINSVWFWYSLDWNIIVHVFWNVIK